MSEGLDLNSVTVGRQAEKVKDLRIELTKAEKKFKDVSEEEYAYGDVKKELTDATVALAEAEAELSKETGGVSSVIHDVVKDLDIAGKMMDKLMSIADKVIESTVYMAQENDNARASFNASTGAAGRYDDELANLELTNRNLGISMDEHAASYGALISGVSGFGRFAEDTRTKLSSLTSQYAKLGVASADMAGIMQTSFNMMGDNMLAFETMTEGARQLEGTLYLA